jgi:hypothetical protein
MTSIHDPDQGHGPATFSGMLKSGVETGTNQSDAALDRMLAPFLAPL